MNTFRISFWTLNLLSFLVCWINCRQAREREVAITIHENTFTHQGTEHSAVTDSADAPHHSGLPLPESKK